jgi:hypothetical protein
MNPTIFDWAVVGAGPAGIAAVGRLIDLGVTPQSILWIDPVFNVGDFGGLWSNVSSNTTVQLFQNFLHASSTFNYANAPIDFAINHLPLDKTCTLNAIVESLQWISNEMCKKVHAVSGIAHQLARAKDHWAIDLTLTRFKAHKVILATGATPLVLDHKTPSIPFDIAIDKQRLECIFNPQETYAVFGSSHSAIMIIRHLVELGSKRIINLYRSPCQYAMNMGDWIKFDNTGLKGDTACWARENIDGKHPSNLNRLLISECNLPNILKSCDKIIYAIGFERRDSTDVLGEQLDQYNQNTGIIAHGLFGLGIAYPELKSDPEGRYELQVGLWKFMLYLNQVLPLWLNQPLSFNKDQYDKADSF